jgi:hypothetical protein
VVAASPARAIVTSAISPERSTAPCAVAKTAPAGHASMAAAKPDASTLVLNGVCDTVTHAEQVKGLSDAELGGMSHGIQSLVTDDKALIHRHFGRRRW